MRLSVWLVTRAALSHLFSCSLLENTGCFTEDCRRLRQQIIYLQLRECKNGMSVMGRLHSWMNRVQLCCTAETPPGCASTFLHILQHLLLSSKPYTPGFRRAENHLPIQVHFQLSCISPLWTKQSRQNPQTLKNMNKDGSKGSETNR